MRDVPSPSLWQLHIEGCSSVSTTRIMSLSFLSGSKYDILKPVKVWYPCKYGIRKSEGGGSPSVALHRNSVPCKWPEQKSQNLNAELLSAASPI